MLKFLNFKLLSKVVCIMGCVYQSLRISELYFSYETITNVKYESEDGIELPDITICVRKLSMVTDKYNEELNKISNSSDIKWEIINTLTISEQLSKLNNVSSRIEKCNFIDQKGIQFSKQDKFITYLSRKWICFTLFSQLIGESEDRYVINDVENSIDSNFMGELIMSKNKMNNTDRDSLVIIQLHDQRERPYNHYKRGYVLFNTERSAFRLIGYRKTVVQYMFEPKGKVCNRGTTRDRCLFDCKVKHFVCETGHYPPNLLAESTNDNLTFYRGSYVDIRSLNSTNRCSQRCSLRTDCYKEHFIMSSTQDNSNLAKQYHSFRIFFEFPSHPTTIYEISLKICFEEYLCLIASIVSLWFGFSVLMFNNFCEEILRKLLIRKNVNILFIKQNFNRFTLNKREKSIRPYSS